MSQQPTVGTEEIQVLEFALGDETYCIEIDNVAELVEMGDLTPIPNTPEYVEGVMDLRGRTTSIIDPKRLLDIDGDGARERIIVLDPEQTEDQNAIGWIADELYEVVRVPGEDISEPPESEDLGVEGIIRRDGEMKVLVDPAAFLG
jgi:purine-binding chemotaxis protein CheW